MTENTTWSVTIKYVGLTANGRVELRYTVFDPGKMETTTETKILDIGDSIEFVAYCTSEYCKSCTVFKDGACSAGLTPDRCC